MLNSPNACKSGHACDVNGIKEAATCGLQHDPINGSLVERAAALCDIKPGTLRDGLNPNEPDWLSLKHLDTIAVVSADHPVIARHFAKLQGGVFFKVDGRQFDQSTANSVVEFGQFLQSVAPGSHMTADVIKRIEKEGEEAIASIAKVIADAKSRALGGGVK